MTYGLHIKVFKVKGVDAVVELFGKKYGYEPARMELRCRKIHPNRHRSVPKLKEVIKIG